MLISIPGPHKLYRGPGSTPKGEAWLLEGECLWLPFIYKEIKIIENYKY